MRPCPPRRHDPPAAESAAWDRPHAHLVPWLAPPRRQTAPGPANLIARPALGRYQVTGSPVKGMTAGGGAARAPARFHGFVPTATEG